MSDIDVHVDDAMVYRKLADEFEEVAQEIAIDDAIDCLIEPFAAMTIQDNTITVFVAEELEEPESFDTEEAALVFERQRQHVIQQVYDFIKVRYPTDMVDRIVRRIGLMGVGVVETNELIEWLDKPEELNAMIEKVVKVLTNESMVSDMAAAIRIVFVTEQLYTFQAVSIDGIHCYPVIYRDSKIVDFESIYISCIVERYGLRTTEKYSMFSYSYTSIEDAILKIQDVINNYKQINGDLVTKDHYELLQMENQLLFTEEVKESKNCVVCYNITTDMTQCKHRICFGCRQSCIMKHMLNCPACRMTNVLPFYNKENGLLNNNFIEY